MVIFTFFDQLMFFDIVIAIIAIYILSSLCFGVLFSSSKNLAFPILLKPFLLFSAFTVSSIIWFCCFNFDSFSNISTTLFYGQIIQLIFLFVCTLILFNTRDFVSDNKIMKFEYDLLFSFMILSALCLCFSDDFLNVYVAIELQSLVLYVFATFNRKSEFSTESGLKYFIFGAIISCFLLLGFSFVYLTFGTTSFNALFNLVYTSDDNLLFLGILFILVAFLFKIGSAPFHAWIPDVYEGAIISVTFIFSAAPKIAIFSVLAKLFLLCFYKFNNIWASIFIFSAILSIAIGSFSAIYQKRIKRLFAYSAISHTGFILLGIVSANPDALKGFFFYIIVYSLITILLFSLLIFTINNISQMPSYIASWTALSLKNSVFAISFSFTLFSIAGIPPFVGFFSKFLVLLQLVAQNYIISSLIIVIISSIACFYYIRLIKTFYFVKTTKNSLWISSNKRQFSEYLIASLLFFNVGFFLQPQLLYLLASILSFTLI